MKAKDLTKGMVVETGRGVKTICASFAHSPRLWCLHFTDAVTILMCPPDTEFTVLEQA